MTIKELVEKYSFHDGSICGMKMMGKDFHVLMELCEDEVNSGPQNNDIIRVIFKNAKVDFDKEIQASAFDAYIDVVDDKVVEENGKIHLELSLEIEDPQDYVEVKITTNDVEVINYGLADEDKYHTFADIESEVD
ncbi:MAG: hypothetical protein LBL34_00275 [Clostridiales bacterium]|jgi:hypothetical protein|nr:hypothetical protein [Clostridiales bacterium]